MAGYTGYQPYAPLVPPAETTAPAPDQSTQQRLLKEAIASLVRKFTQDPAEVLAAQEGPAIGHLGGE